MLAASVAAIAVCGALGACSTGEGGAEGGSDGRVDGSGEDASTQAAPSPAAEPSSDAPETAGGDTVIGAGSVIALTVDGAMVPGLDTMAVACTRKPDGVTIRGDSLSSTFAVTASGDEVVSVAISHDRTRLAMGTAPGAEPGSAEVAVDGSTYTVTGVASSMDLDDAGAEPEKRFRIIVTCR